MIGFMSKNDCLPLKGPMSAQEFLKYVAATVKLEYVADEPVPVCTLAFSNHLSTVDGGPVTICGGWPGAQAESDFIPGDTVSVQFTVARNSPFMA